MAGKLFASWPLAASLPLVGFVSAAFLGVFICRSIEADRVPGFAHEPPSHRPVGKLISAPGDRRPRYSTSPAAYNLPSPHRVSSVHNSKATNWTFVCTGTGACPEYYGDAKYVSQPLVDELFETGLLRLTGAQSLAAAWQILLPDYHNGDKIAVKVNFNDSIFGGGQGGWADDDAYIDALPQPVNSLVRTLKFGGIQEADIYVYDASRPITQRFVSRLAYSGIRLLDVYGDKPGIERASWSSSNPSAWIDFSGSLYTTPRKVVDLLVNAKYLINMPIMKRHGNAQITLSLKNHLGSLDNGNSPYGVSSGSLHEYIYPGRANYSPTSNPIVNMNLNANIRDKTVLVVGDALYGGRMGNNTPPERWPTFNNDSPNMLLFAADPIAIDSVMADYHSREIWFGAQARDILIAAANAGLGVYEHWNTNSDRRYSLIDYVELDLDTVNPDINLSGLADAEDMLDCAEIIAELNADAELRARADQNRDGGVDARDVQRIANSIMTG